MLVHKTRSSLASFQTETLPLPSARVLIPLISPDVLTMRGRPNEHTRSIEPVVSIILHNFLIDSNDSPAAKSRNILIGLSSLPYFESLFVNTKSRSPRR